MPNNPAFNTLCGHINRAIASGTPIVEGLSATDANAKHYRRIELRRKMNFQDLTESEFAEYLDLSHALETAFHESTIAYGRIKEFIPMDIA